MKFCNLSGQPVPVFEHGHNVFFPSIKSKFPIFQFVPIASCPSIMHPCEILHLCVFHQVLVHHYRMIYFFFQMWDCTANHV